MKITFYELLGLVKDGKAPKKIKYSGIEYNLIEGDYVNEFGVNILQHLTYAEYIMTHKVEIIEEPKKIKKIEMYQDEEGHYFLNKQDRKVYVNCDEIDFMVDKFNELIDEINNLKEND